MGTNCTCSCQGNEEVSIDDLYGTDDTGVMESFQYHHTKLAEYDVKLNFYDKFYRETCRPMYLINFKEFNQIIDEMGQRHGCMVAKERHDFAQTEFINANKFKFYVKENSMQPPVSLFFKQISSESSPFLKMVGMNNIFVVKDEKHTLLSGRVEHLRAFESCIQGRINEYMDESGLESSHCLDGSLKLKQQKAQK